MSTIPSIEIVSDLHLKRIKIPKNQTISPNSLMSVNCPLEHLCSLLPAKYKPSISTRLNAVSKSKYSSINDSVWKERINKRLTGVYVDSPVHVKIVGEYVALAVNDPDSDRPLSVYYHRKGYYEIKSLSIKIYSNYISHSAHRGTYVPIYELICRSPAGVSQLELKDCASKAELAAAGRFMPSKITFADGHRNPIIQVNCLKMVTVGLNGLISEDLNDPQKKIYFLIHCYAPSLPLIDIEKGHVVLVTDGNEFYMTSRHLSTHAFIAQKNKIDMSKVSLDPRLLRDAIHKYCQMINGSL